jgi:probable HAF family extracellular repeat protein
MSVTVQFFRAHFDNVAGVPNGGNMHSRQSMFITAIALFAATMISVQFAQAQGSKQAPKYYVFNLGAPLGGNAEPVGINNLGWISGGDNLSGNTSVNAELWIGTPIDLGTLGGPNSTISWPNHTTRGEIVGIAETAQKNPLGEAWSCSAFFFGPDGYICNGFAWRDGVMTPLPPFQGGYDSYAAGVNNRGQIVGWAENSVLDPTCNNQPPVSQFLQFEAAIWGPGLTEMSQLPPYPGDPDSAATAINDRGQVVGISGLCANAVGGTSATHALLWENGQTINLGNLGAQAWNTPVSLNNHGQVVGFANNTANNAQGFVWTQESGMQALPFIGDDNSGVAYDINEKGQIVGISNGGSEPYGARAFLYEHGHMMDINELIEGETSLYLLLAQGINDNGEIVGTAIDLSGEEVGFLAVPAYDGAGTNASIADRDNNSHKFAPPSNFRPRLSGFSRLLFEAKEAK